MNDTNSETRYKSCYEISYEYIQYYQKTADTVVKTDNNQINLT